MADEPLTKMIHHPHLFTSGVLQVLWVIACIFLLILANRVNRGNGPLFKLRKKESFLSAFAESGTRDNSSNQAVRMDKIASAREYLQTALDQESQANSACARASSGSKSYRMQAAEQAYYFAQAAHEAAGNATSAASGGPLEANEAATRAREAAWRAQGAADRARYNAATAR